MAVTVFETGDSRGGSSRNWDREYYAYGSSDEGEIVAAVLSFGPSNVTGLLVRDYDAKEIDDSLTLWKVTLKYGTGENFPPDVDSWDYKFSFQAPSAQIYQSLSTISAVGTDPEDFKGAINVVVDGGKQRVEGFNLAPPAEVFTIGYYPAASGFSTSYQNTIRGLVGKVANATYKGCPAGSIMLSRASGGMKSSEQASLEFGFAFVENQTSIPVGDLTVPAKDGFDLLWPYYDDSVGGSELIKTPRWAYVERIWYRADLNALGV